MSTGHSDNEVQELGELTTSPPSGVTVELKDESNLHIWKVGMDGPSGSPYAVCGHPQTRVIFVS